MKKKVINKVSDLPSEFALANYKATQEFGICDWLVNLEFRALRRHIAADLEERKLSARYIFRNALLPETVCLAYSETGLSKMIHENQVRSQSAFDALANHYYFEDDSRLNEYTSIFLVAEHTHFSKNHYDKLIQTPMWKALHESGIDTSGDVNVSVNLQASEDQLVDDFRTWVRATKKEMGIDVPRKPLTETDLKDFSQFQLLPYLDLTFWAQTEGVEISYQTLGLALFPDEYERVLSERVRKVVAPMARRVVSFDYCAFLRSQVVALPPEARPLKFVPDGKKVLLDPGSDGNPIDPEQLI